MEVDFVLAPALSDPHREPALTSSPFYEPDRARRYLATAFASGASGVVIDEAAGVLANLDVAANVARWHHSLEVIATHWAGVTSPTVAAGDIAALDHVSGGRLSLRILVDGTPENAEARGHLAAWQRADEYITLLKRLWANSSPIDHEGTFYRLHSALLPERGPRGPGLPIRMSGRSGTAVDVSARHASVFEIPDGTFDEQVALVDRIETAAARYGRAGRIRFAVAPSLRAVRDPRDLLSRYLAAGVSQFMIGGLSDVVGLTWLVRDAAFAVPSPQGTTVAALENRLGLR